MKHLNILFIISAFSYASVASALQLKDFNFSVDNQGIRITPADKRDKYDNDSNTDHRDRGYRKHHHRDRSKDDNNQSYQGNNSQSQKFTRKQAPAESEQINQRSRIKRDAYGRRYKEDNDSNQAAPKTEIGDAWTSETAQPAPIDKAAPSGKVIRQTNEQTAPGQNENAGGLPPPTMQQQAAPPPAAAVPKAYQAEQAKTKKHKKKKQ